MMSIQSSSINKIHRISSFGLASLFFILSLAISIYLRSNTAAVDGFFAELGNVSAALASGKGISNVFTADSGPTAWCPLMNVLLYALVFKIFGVKSVAAFWALITLRCLLLAVTLYWLLEIDYSEIINKYKFLLLPIFLVYTTLVLYRSGPKDAMFTLFLSSLLLYLITKVLDFGFTKRIYYWFVLLAIILPLANISLAIAFFLFVLTYSFTPWFKTNSQIRQKTVVLLLLMALTYTGWGVRNYMVLGKFIPFKSNLWFELYISNVVDDDGLLKYSNYKVYHPYSNKQVAQSYVKLAEVPFLDSYGLASKEYLTTQPFDFFSKILNRSTNIFLYAKTEKDTERASLEKLSPHDLSLLESNSLLLDEHWVCLGLSRSEFIKTISGLNLSNQDVVIADWEQKVNMNKGRVDGMVEIVKGLLTSLIPTLALIFGFAVSNLRMNRVFLITVVILFLGIGPYMVISWIPRYQSFQLVMFTVILFMTISYLIHFFIKRKSKFIRQQTDIDTRPAS